jgi:hypothetical protein
VAETLANEIGAKTEILNPLEGLTNKGKKRSGYDCKCIGEKRS